MTKVLTKTLAVTLTTMLAAISISVAASPNALAVTYASGVTQEMTTTSFWTQKTIAASNVVLASAEEIKAKNAEMLHSEDTNMHDLEAMTSEYDANKLFPYEYLGGVEAIDNEAVSEEEAEAFFANIKQAITDTKYTDTRIPQYAVAVKYANIKCVPTEHALGYFIDDTDDEAQLSALCVNEPFVIKQKCETEEGTYYWGYSNNCIGWVNSESVAICASYDEWIDAWKVDIDEDDFLVITQSKVYTEKSNFSPEVSGVMLSLGTIVKLVPEEESTGSVDERAAWHNHIIYLPIRNDDGSYSKHMALLPERYSTSIGFLPYTQENAISIAMSCIGDRYGWGGMLDSMDCSAYISRIYSCFGYKLPRNTSWQMCIPGSYTDISEMGVAEKQRFIETLPSGTMLYFRGHAMMYLGSVDGAGYVIADTGMLYDEGTYVSVQGVVINPLTVKRGIGRTWLESLCGVVTLGSPVDIEDSGVSVKLSQTSFNYDGKSHTPTVSVTNAAGETLPTSAYSVSCAAQTKVGTYKATITFNTPSISGTTSASWSIVKNGWLKEGGVWKYYVAGKMKTGWQKVSGKWYYMDSKGAMKTGWQKVSGKWYYLGGNGVMRTGWQKVSGKWYYLGGNGAMRTGWQKVSGKWYYFDSSGVWIK